MKRKKLEKARLEAQEEAQRMEELHKRMQVVTGAFTDEATVPANENVVTDYQTAPYTTPYTTQMAENVDIEVVVAAGDVHHFEGVRSVNDPLWMTNYELIYSHPELMLPWYATMAIMSTAETHRPCSTIRTSAQDGTCRQDTTPRYWKTTE